MQVDLNCDVGEGMPSDAQIIPLISSANIACGFHAGDEMIMKRTMEICLRYGVAIGAHPSWPDREYFGRRERQASSAEIYKIIADQLHHITSIATELGVKLHHIKPHGALYNQSAKNQTIAAAIAQAVYDFDASLLLVGLSGSISLQEASVLGLQTVHEVFADRTYQNDGSLTARSQPNALIEDDQTAMQQVLQMINQQTVTTLNGTIVPVKADSICLHGDGTNAVAFAQTILSALQKAKIDIKAN